MLLFLSVPLLFEYYIELEETFGILVTKHDFRKLKPIPLIRGVWAQICLKLVSECLRFDVELHNFSVI